MNETTTYERFRVTKEHIKLLRRAYVGWQGREMFGAPAIDCKRPYGNSDVLGDIAEILGLPKRDEDTGAFPTDQEHRMWKLHGETQLALQVILSAGSFTPGIYETEINRDKWKLVKSEATR